MPQLMLRRGLSDAEIRNLHPLGDLNFVDHEKREMCRRCNCFGDPCICALASSMLWTLADPWSDIMMTHYLRQDQVRVRDRLIRVEEAMQRGDRGWGDLIEHFERYGFRVIDEDSQRPALAAAGIIDGEFREAS